MVNIYPVVSERDVLEVIDSNTVDIDIVLGFSCLGDLLSAILSSISSIKVPITFVIPSLFLSSIVLLVPTSSLCIPLSPDTPS